MRPRRCAPRRVRRWRLRWRAAAIRRRCTAKGARPQGGWSRTPAHRSPRSGARVGRIDIHLRRHRGQHAGADARLERLRSHAPRRLIVSAIEHPSVLRVVALRQPTCAAPVTADGVIDLEGCASCSAPADRRSCRSCSPTTKPARFSRSGSCALVHEAGGILHVDAVQALGRVPLESADVGADLLTLSAHKIGGPKGAGALVVCNGDLQMPRR